MSQIYTLKDIDNSNDTKLGKKPFNRYPPNHAELEEQLSRANKDQERVLEAANQLIDKYDILDEENKCIRSELDQAQKENEHIQDSLDQSKKDNNALNDEIKHIQYSLNQTITERDDLKHRESLKDQVAKKYEALNEENKCIQASLDQSKKDNDALIEENRRMQDSQKQIYTRIKELYNDNDELYSQISSERKSHAELTANYLKKLKSHKFTINALENKLAYTAKEVSLKDSDIAVYRDRIEELNQNMDNRDYLISRLKAREKDLKDKLECLELEHSSQEPNRTESSDKVQNDHDTNLLENPAKHGGTIDETTCSKISAEAPSQKLAKQNITSAVPSIAILGAGKALPLAPDFIASGTAASEEYIPPSMFHVMYFILAILVIWCILTLIEKFQRSSGAGLHFKDDFVHFPEKTVYLSDLTPAR